MAFKLNRFEEARAIFLTLKVSWEYSCVGIPKSAIVPKDAFTRAFLYTLFAARLPKAVSMDTPHLLTLTVKRYRLKM